MTLNFLFNPLDDRWFAFICSTAFGCWWIWMLAMPKHWAHVPLRQIPVTRVMFVLLLAVIWPVVFVAQFALGYDWKQFGNDEAASPDRTNLPANATREIATQVGAIRGLIFVLVPALLLDVLGLCFIAGVSR